MNNRPLSVICCLLALCTFVSADQDATPAQKVAASKEAWAKASAEHGGNYEYSVRKSSFTGSGNETVIVAKGGKIVERRYRAWSGRPVPVAPGAQPQDDGTSWTETGDQLGKHKEGAPLKTIEDLYAEAAMIAQHKLEPSERLYVNFDKAGLLQNCFYVDTRIADDAPHTGVSIGAIKLVKAEK